MARIIKVRSIETCCEFYLSFVWCDNPNAGFEFPCDKNGNVSGLKPAGQANYEKCINGTHNVFSKGITKHEWNYAEPAELRCDCGCTVILDSNTNTCDRCGYDYNMSGQALASRSQWGEETGEHWTDCM